MPPCHDPQLFLCPSLWLLFRKGGHCCAAHFSPPVVSLEHEEEEKHPQEELWPREPGGRKPQEPLPGSPQPQARRTRPGSRRSLCSDSHGQGPSPLPPPWPPVPLGACGFPTGEGPPGLLLPASQLQPPAVEALRPHLRQAPALPSHGGHFLRSPQLWNSPCSLLCTACGLSWPGVDARVSVLASAWGLTSSRPALWAGGMSAPPSLLRATRNPMSWMRSYLCLPMDVYISIILFLNTFLLVSERKGEGERARNIDERKSLIGCLLHASYWGWSPQPGHVP
uniref:Uncharacterized protein n=1 Tax=Myotis myotis TaxID=51298 RepID=A0A7J7R1V9_MYOMY|nr:hypothetical protein mMyoMyo1_011210 [Myotis myotis]